MGETPAPQDPNQDPSQPAGAPKETPTTEQPIDWRLLVIIGVAVLFLIAAFVNRKYYGQAKPAPKPEAAQGRADNQPPPGPPQTPAEQYANLVRGREMEALDAMFTLGDKRFIVAIPAVPVAKRDNPKEMETVLPGRLFDVTRTVEGVKPEMLHRRGIFGPQSSIAFIDTFVPLGMPNGPAVVAKPAAEVPVNVIGDTQRVIGLRVGDEARAYPVKFLNYHDVINDVIADQPVVLAWSALVSGATAMSRALPDGKTAAFGSAGLMFQGAIVLYDADTVSLWSATGHRAEAGPLAGAELKPLQVTVATWQSWKKLNPNTTAMIGTNPAMPANYDENPAVPSGYMSDSRILYPIYGFNVDTTPMRLKAYVFGVYGPDGKSVKAYELGLLRAAEGAIEDIIGGQKVTIQYERETNLFTALGPDGKPLLNEGMFWLAWVGAHPKTEVWQEEKLKAALNPPAEPPKAGQPKAAPAPAAQ